jgi:FMN phosphatase YigB (HAD superfamily)
MTPAVIVDVDGTLCDVSGIRHLVMGENRKRKDSFHRFHTESEHCPPHRMALDYVTDHFDSGHTILVVSGRSERWRDLTERYLHRHMPRTWAGLWMRPDSDYRPDTEVKADIYHRLRAHYDIRGAIDDRPVVVDLWRSLGLAVTVVPGWPDGEN